MYLWWNIYTYYVSIHQCHSNLCMIKKSYIKLNMLACIQSYGCMYVWSFVCVYAWLYLWIPVWIMCICLTVCFYVCIDGMHGCVAVGFYVCIQVYTNSFMYVCMFDCLLASMYVYIFMFDCRHVLLLLWIY